MRELSGRGSYGHAACPGLRAADTAASAPPTAAKTAAGYKQRSEGEGADDHHYAHRAQYTLAGF